jgi:sulfur carrier protein
MILVNGEKHNWHEEMTVADLLEELGDSDKYAVVRINDKHISRPYFGKTPIPDNATVFLMPLIAGG